ncbi:uncharacterized protein CLUP02_07576 [Colletotrichum lupini]|uniref:Uncharacterized protein n=1 Tax=Colletotrichum lupini TaxID=145971 RepID=A0A9Q8SS64_9PEZI|nr:uncharacterized protein CLUP02_07576 [Colletotrichum lupini]UQC82090.1 hypothetical protein CLUP02_07576 [Colletotrichum lupini]
MAEGQIIKVSSDWAPGERLSRHGNRLAGGLGDGSRRFYAR